MKISNNTLNYINQSYTNPAGTAAKSSAGAGPKPQTGDPKVTDSIELSSTIRDLQKISAAAAQDPEGRTERVAELKRQYQTDQYNVNAEAVAEKMITGTFMNGLG